MTRVLLLSTYEQGHQPLGLAAPAAALRAAGIEVECRDLAVESADLDVIRRADLVAISAPMHTAARLGLRVAERVRATAPHAHLAWYGLYASPLAGLLRRRGLADSVLGGEYEPGLVALARRLAVGDSTPLVRLEFERQRYPVPDRSGLPPLDRYARVLREDGAQLSGYVDTTRGCAHQCTHCPLTAVYDGRLRLVQSSVVLADVAQQVAAGARHITFGDPDFLNASGPALEIARALHEAHPEVTFDVTTKVEHILEHAPLIEELGRLGCLFITSAFESCSDDVLGRLAKGHTGADLGRALDIAGSAGVALRPTWMAFTPWTTLEGFLAMLEFIEARGLVRHVQPVQYGLRLLLPPGSPLIEVIRTEGVLGPLDEELLTYEWTHADPRMDRLQRELAALAETEAARHDHDDQDFVTTFALVKRAALQAAGRTGPVTVAPQPTLFVSGLAESWFC